MAKAELDLANSSYDKEKEVLDKLMSTYQQSGQEIDKNKK